jgi:plastocyanin
MNRILKTLLIGAALAMAGLAQTQYYVQRPWTVVSMTNDAFVPQTITVSPGTTIVWPNYDEGLHSVRADVSVIGPNSFLFFRNGYPGGHYFWWAVPDNVPSGTVIYYHCTFHGSRGNGRGFGNGMVGRIVVI